MFPLVFDPTLGGSSSGRTADSDSVNLGSNPSPPAINQNGPEWGRFGLWAEITTRVLGIKQLLSKGRATVAEIE